MDKKTERMTIWVSERTKIDLMRAAAEDDRALGDFVGHIFSLFLYGHLADLEARCEAAERGESRR